MANLSGDTPIEYAQQNDPSHTEPASIAPPQVNVRIQAPQQQQIPPQEEQPVQQHPRYREFKKALAKNMPTVYQQHYDLVRDALKGKTPKHESLDSMLAVAPHAKEHIDQLGESIAKKIGSQHPISKADVKGRERALEKIEKEYQGDHNRVTDLVRNTVLVSSRKELAEFLKAAKEHGAVHAVHVKGDEAGMMGYSGGQAKFMTPHGIHGEVQANTPTMIVAKEKPEVAKKMLGEEHYEKIAALFKKHGIEQGLGHSFYERARSIAPTRGEWKELSKKSKAYYDAVRKMEDEHERLTKAK